MSESDRLHWDPRHTIAGKPDTGQVGPPSALAHVEHLFPTRGRALELACGRGGGGIWLARRGMTYRGVDVSPVAIDLARQLARETGQADRCRFEVFDLDDGLPEGELVDLLLCHLFRKSPGLDTPMVDRLAPGGMLAVVSLSVVGATSPGRFHAPPGELRDAFGHLEVLDEGEQGGLARIVALKR